MTEQTPEPVDPVDDPLDEAGETPVETEKTTNDLSKQDDVEVAEDQTPEPQPDAEDNDIRVLHQDGDTVLIGHPAGTRYVEDPDLEQDQ
jgi:hypothetical protein